jgi:hypothetical protein
MEGRTNRKNGNMISRLVKKWLGIKDVYIMYLIKKGKVKIGVSENTERREGEVEGDFGETETWIRFQFVGATTVEKRMHKVFKSYHSPEKHGSGKTELFKIPFYLRWQVVVVLWLMKAEQMILTFIVICLVVYVLWIFRSEMLAIIRIIANL